VVVAAATPRPAASVVVFEVGFTLIGQAAAVRVGVFFVALRFVAGRGPIVVGIELFVFGFKKNAK